MTHHVKSQTTLPHIKRSSALLMRYSLLASLALHLGCIAIVLLMQLIPSVDLNGTPQELVIPIFLVPLSALETNLPPRVVLEQKSLPAPTQVPAHSLPKQPLPKQPMTRIVAQAIKAQKQSAPSYDNTESTIQSSQAATAANGDPSEPARISYQDMVATLIARAKRYPEHALRRHTTGDGIIRIKISSGGSLTDLEIIRSTDSPILDEELKDMVHRAAPFPAFPNDLRKNSLALTVPVSFQLKN